MKSYCSWIKESGFARETATLLGGNLLAQVIALLAYLVLARIYTPENYALFNIFYSYIEVLIIISTCKYELAIVVAKDSKEAAAVARFALRMNSLVSLVLLTAALVLYLANSLPGNYAELGAIALLVPPMVWLVGSSRVYSGLYNRVRRYQIISASLVTNSTLGAVLKILFGSMGMHSAGLPLGTVLGQAVANLVLRLRMRSLNMPATHRIDRREAARQHRNFPFFVATKDFMNSLSANLPFLWLAFYFDRTEVGLFGLALVFTFRPINLLCSAFERVLYARTAEKVRLGLPIGHSIRRFLLWVNLVSLPAFSLLWWVAEPLFVLLFGDQWTGCGVYVRALIPWMYLALSSTSLMFVSNVFSTQRTELYFYLTTLVLRVAALGLGICLGEFLSAIWLFGSVGAAMAFALLVWYIVQVRRYDSGLVGQC